MLLLIVKNDLSYLWQQKPGLAAAGGFKIYVKQHVSIILVTKI